MPNIGESVQGNPIRAIIIGGSDGGPNSARVDAKGATARGH